MATAPAGLELPIGLTEQKFMQQLARIEARAIKSAQRAEQGFAKANAGIVRSSERASRSMAASFGGIGRSAAIATAKVTALAGALAKITTSSQSYKVVENRLRSLGEYSDEAAESLAGAAIRSRTGLEDMATAVARIQKATGDGYDQTIRRVETLNKLLAVGGATASEASSVMMQLSQALTSGTLQGDELRSLRENAPIEFMDALAAAAGVTRGELKQLGADGKLTSEIITQALDTLAATADEKFGRTTQTIGQAFTNLNTGLTMFIGRLDEGIGATGGFSAAISSMGAWLTESADTAEEFGRSITAALQTGSEIAGQVDAAMMALADTIYTELVQGSILDMGGAFEEGGMTAAEVIDAIIYAIADMNGVIEGAAAAAREAFLQIPDAVSAGMQGAINAVISGVESMVNIVLNGVRAVASAIDTLTAKIPGGTGTNLAGGIGNVSFGRVEGVATNLSGGSISDAYRSGYKSGSTAVTDAVGSVKGFFEGVGETYNRNRAKLEAADIANETVPAGVTPPGKSGTAPASGGSAGGGGRKRSGGRGRAGGAGREERPFFENVEKDLMNLERQLQLIGKTSEETATLKARWELLDEAKKRGIPLNDTLNAQINAQAAEVGRLTGELERAEIAQDQFEDAIDGIADAMAGALVGGESLREGLAKVFQQIAMDILKSGIKNALMSQFGGMGGGGGGNILGSIFGGMFGGFRAAGGPVSAGSAYVVGERGPELIVPRSPGTVIPNHALRSGGGGSMNINVNVAGARGNAEIEAMVQSGVMQGLASYDKTMPDRVQRIAAQPRRR